MNFQKSWDIYFQKVLDHDFWKFMEHDFLKFKELCFSVFLYFCDKKPTVEKTFIFLIQSILFSNGGLLHREKKFLFREIKILGGGF